MPKSKSRAAVIDRVSTRAAESRVQAVGPDWSALVPGEGRDPDRLSAPEIRIRVRSEQLQAAYYTGECSAIPESWT